MYFNNFFIKYCLKVEEIKKENHKKNKSFIWVLLLLLLVIMFIVNPEYFFNKVILVLVISLSVISVLVIRYLRLKLEKKLISFYEDFSYKRKEALLELLNEYNIDIKDTDSFLKIVKEKEQNNSFIVLKNFIRPFILIGIPLISILIKELVRGISIGDMLIFFFLTTIICSIITIFLPIIEEFIYWDKEYYSYLIDDLEEIIIFKNFHNSKQNNEVTYTVKIKFLDS